jgi:F420-dependent oxidoreductase-like protein
MRFGYHLGYWGAGPPPGIGDAAAAVERLGFDSLWAAEAYGSDALTPLAWWGSRTSRVALGTCVAQMAARSPTATAMAAMTLDHLSGGRFVLGLGASGPRVVEGWYGQPFDRPLARTREYVTIVRDVVARRAPVTSDGEHYPLPYRPPARAGGAAPPAGGTAHQDAGAGIVPLRSTLHPVRADLPVHLAAEGPRNVALAAEIADGWLPLFFSPRLDGTCRELLAEGFARRSSDLRPRSTFEVSATVPVVVGEDAEAAADVVRPFVALYVGGMGTASTNFHHDAVARLGYAPVADEIRSRYLAGDRAGAAAAVPLELIDDIALVGPAERIRARLPAWEASVVTRIIVWSAPAALAEVAAVLRPAGGGASPA